MRTLLLKNMFLIIYIYIYIYVCLSVRGVWHKQTNSITLKRRLRWCGHPIHLFVTMLPKQLLHWELAAGKKTCSQAKIVSQRLSETVLVNENINLDT